MQQKLGVMVGHGGKADDNMTHKCGDVLLANSLNKDTKNLNLKDNIDIPGHEITNCCLPGGHLIE